MLDVDFHVFSLLRTLLQSFENLLTPPNQRLHLCQTVVNRDGRWLEPAQYLVVDGCVEGVWVLLQSVEECGCEVGVG